MAPSDWLLHNWLDGDFLLIPRQDLPMSDAAWTEAAKAVLPLRTVIDIFNQVRQAMHDAGAP